MAAIINWFAGSGWHDWSWLADKMTWTRISTQSRIFHRAFLVENVCFRSSNDHGARACGSSMRARSRCSAAPPGKD
jgi:hypothetical protein